VTVERVRDAGFEALVVTVDSPAANNREFDTRNGAVFPPRVTLQGTIDSLLHPRWLVGTLGRYALAERGMPGFPNVHIPDDFPFGQRREFLARNDSLTWDFLRRVRDMWPRTLIVKGILHPDDAVMAADCGADGIIVSNHAGNTNDAAVTPIDALPAVVAAVGDRVTIIIDSGFRRGSDVLKGLALGADAVAVGRATLYGVGAAGEAGATRALEILHAEIHRTMGIMGLTDLRSITRDHVVLPPQIPAFERGVR
jgi:isopentenyl diphosphate isomerase/L-lactate dehydrogenase-like FMN-dependent dehydrogenase